MTNSAPQFTTQDAQALVSQAESAPLQHMGHAAAGQQVLKRFSDWYHYVTEKIETFDTEVEAKVKAELEKVKQAELQFHHVPGNTENPS